MDCCHHSFHKKEHQEPTPRFMQTSTNICYCLLVGLGVLCCHLHCVGASSISATFKNHAHDARTSRHLTTHETQSSRSNRHGPNATLPTQDDFISMLFDVKLTNESFAMSDKRLVNITQKLKIGLIREHHVHYSENGEPSPRPKVVTQASGNLIIIRHEEVIEEPLNGTCWSLNDLRKIFNTPSVPMPVDEFQRICPALIHQVYFDTCIVPPVDLEGNGKTPLSSAKTYGYGTVAVVLSSTLSMVGVVIIPFLSKRSYKYAMQGFIALGVGALTGDALLHLLPEALHLRDDISENEYQHSAHSYSHDDPRPGSNLAFWRMVACGAAVYIFFLWEVALHSFIHRRTKKAVQSNLPHNAELHNHEHDHGDHEHSHIPDRDVFRAPQLKTLESCSSSVSFESKEDGKSSNVDATKYEHEDYNIFGMKPLAWVIFLGDALHNFADGLAIAAAFSDDVASGIATTVAIFCHEIPHELGDFALLLSTGLSFKRVLFLNVVTAGISLLGFYIGVPISQHEQAREWILTVTAGTFLYVALADMLPELKNGAKTIKIIFVQNTGLIFGFSVMLLMALFEDVFQG